MRQALAALLLLAGCGEAAAPPPERAAAVAAADQPSAVPAARPKRLEFAGRWAVSPAMCETGWWNFGGDEIRTAGELSCRVVRDERTATSATLRLGCIGEGMTSTETWRLAGTSEQMIVTRDEGDAVTLVKCPPR